MSTHIDPDPRKLLSDKDMLTLVIDRFEASKKMIDRFRDKWDRYYKQYRSFVETNPGDWPFDTNLFIPLTFSTVESFLPRMVAQRPRITVEARNDEDIPVASNHREVLEYQWGYLGMPYKLIELAKSSLIYGVAWAKIGWLRKVRTRKFNTVLEDGSGRVVENIRDIVSYDAPVVDIVDNGNLYPDPEGTSPEDCRYIAEHYKLQWYQLDERTKPVEEGGLGWNKKAVAKLKKIRGAKAQQQLEENARLRRNFNDANTDPALDQAHIYEFDVIEYWEDERHAVVVLSPDTMLFNDFNPYWHGRKPYIRLVDNVLPGELMGIGEPEVLDSLNKELNILHNLRVENVKRDTMQMFKVKIGSPAWSHDIRFMPQGKIPVMDMDDIQELFTRGPKSISSREEEQVRLWAQLATGATDPFTGIESSLGSETATGASLLAQAATSRVGLKFQILTEMTLRPLGQLLISLNEQFLTKEQLITIVGPEGGTHTKMSPEQLATNGAELDVRIDVGATDPVNRELSLQRNTQALQLLLQVFQDPNHPVIQRIVARLLDLLEIQITPEEQEERPVPLEQEAQAQEAAQEQGLLVNPTSRGGQGVGDILARQALGQPAQN